MSFLSISWFAISIALDMLIPLISARRSGAIKGIGEKMAERIVKTFGDDTFRIMEEEPERLAEIKGISMSKAMDIANQLIDKKDIRKAMMFLQRYGIQMNLANKIFRS